MRRILPLLERAHEACKVTEEEVLGGAQALGGAYMCMQQWDRCEAYLEWAAEGFVRLLGADSAKAVRADFTLMCFKLSCGLSIAEQIAELRPLWERVKVTLPDEAVTYDIASQLALVLNNQDDYNICNSPDTLEGEKVLYLAAVEGRRRVLGEEHEDTLHSMNNLVAVLQHGGQRRALDFKQSVLSLKEKVLGKTHYSTVATIEGMARVHMDGLKVFTKAEEMYRLALDRYEKTMGKDHFVTKRCAMDLIRMLRAQGGRMISKRSLATIPGWTFGGLNSSKRKAAIRRAAELQPIFTRNVPLLFYKVYSLPQN